MSHNLKHIFHAGNDFVDKSVAEILARVERAKAANDNKPKAKTLQFPPGVLNNAAQDDSVDAETLLGMEFAPLEYVIPGYIVEGLTVLGGKPKLGKSWWA
jgi:hypothetical protein